jgi:flagellar basal body rod protein FlgB
VDEDEDPEHHGREPDVVHEFSQQNEGAGSIAQTETHHLDEDEDDCEDVEGRHEDFDESDEKQRNNDNSLSLHHERTSSILLVELPSK